MQRKRRVPRVATEDGHLTVIGYVRVSTEEQSRDGSSLINQEEKIRLYCELHELDLVRVERDAGISAKNLDRPGLTTVLEDLRRGRAGGLVITKLDRLTRSLGDWSNLIEELFGKHAGRRLFSVNDSIDTGTASGLLVLDVLMSVAQWERRIIAERTADALQGKIGRGERCGKVRFGYRLDPNELHPKTGRPYKLVPDEREQAAIATLRQWRDQGKTYREMAALITELGIETQEPGSIWRPGVIHRILTRPIA